MHPVWKYWMLTSNWSLSLLGLMMSEYLVATDWSGLDWRPVTACVRAHYTSHHAHSSSKYHHPPSPWYLLHCLRFILLASSAHIFSFILKQIHIKVVATGTCCVVVDTELPGHHHHHWSQDWAPTTLCLPVLPPPQTLFRGGSSTDTLSSSSYISWSCRICNLVLLVQFNILHDLNSNTIMPSFISDLP